ncbi:MAG: nicotinate-nucleotide--dimethylbenzimidazole phosphoribosyltransferase [Thermoplasmataceae archaeon]
MNQDDLSDTLFVLLAGSTEVSKIPGITSAGASPELTMITPVVDSEIIVADRPISTGEPPMTPDGIPTPAIVTKACLDLAGVKCLVVNAGYAATPKIPFFQTNLGPAKNPAEEKSLPDFRRAFEMGIYLGKLIDGRFARILLAESIPGGTTTSQAVLSSMGLNLNTSSTMPSDPVDIKREVVRKAIDRAGYYPENPEMAVEQYGDYMMAIALGVSKSVRDSALVFSGGTQMSSLFYINNKINKNSSKRFQVTTRWVMNHKRETIESLVPPQNLIVSDISFSGMREKGLRLYEEGNVREGAGMGGAFWLASLKEKNMEKIYANIEQFYRRLRQ